MGVLESSRGPKKTQLIGAEVGNFSCKDGPRVTRRGIDPFELMDSLTYCLSDLKGYFPPLIS
jgi:hypothetical protein